MIHIKTLERIFERWVDATNLTLNYEETETVEDFLKTPKWPITALPYDEAIELVTDYISMKKFIDEIKCSQSSIVGMAVKKTKHRAEE